MIKPEKKHMKTKIKLLEVIIEAEYSQEEQQAGSTGVAKEGLIKPSKLASPEKKDMIQRVKGICIATRYTR